MSTNPLDTLTGIPLASQAFTNAALGPPVVGWMVALMLYGVLIARFFAYSQTTLFAADSRRVKALLFVVILLATAQTALMFWSLYHYATWQDRSANMLRGQTVVDCFSTTFVSIEGALVQIYLGRRAVSFMNRRIVKVGYLVLLSIGILGEMTGSVLYLVSSFLLRSGSQINLVQVDFNTTVSAWLWSSAGVDILVTLGLCGTLSSHLVNFNTAHDRMLKQVMRLTLETASYTAVCALMGGILGHVFQANCLNGNSSGAFWQPLSAFYALSLLTTLNQRSRLRETLAKTNIVSTQFPLSATTLNQPLSFPATVSTTNSTRRNHVLAALYSPADSGACLTIGEFFVKEKQRSELFFA